MSEIAPLDPVEIGWDCNRVVGGGTEPSIPQTSYLFDDKMGKKNLFWAILWLFGGFNKVNLGRKSVRLSPLIH